MSNLFSKKENTNIGQTFVTQSQSQSKGGAVGLYKIDLKKAEATGGKYRSVIRLLPNVNSEGEYNPEKTAVTKKIHYVKLPNAELTGYYDSPKSIGERCELSDCYWTLDKSPDPNMKQRAECLSFSTKHYCYAQIIEDRQQPELEGKIMVFQFGTKIFQLIESMTNKDITGEEEDVFDLAEGHNLILNVEKVGGFPNYNKCTFDFNRTPIKIPDAEGNLKSVGVVEQDGGMSIKPEAQQAVIDYLKVKMGDVKLEDFEFKPHTEETKSKVKRIVSFLMGQNTNTAAQATNEAAGGVVESTTSGVGGSYDEQSSPVAEGVEDSQDDFSNIFGDD